MQRKIVWMLVSCLMALSLVMASCGPAEEEEGVEVEEEEVVEEEVEEEVVEEGIEMVTDTLGRLVEKPEYGGTLTMAFTGSPRDWDECFQPVWVTWGNRIVCELVTQGNWLMGPSGTGEVGFTANTFPFPSFMTGCLAESWEIVDDETLIFNIRKGVHFQDKPPTNGREMDAYDVEYSLLRMVNCPQSYNHVNYALGKDLKSITALDKWTVEMKSMPGRLSRVWSGYVGTEGWVIPHEVIEEYGDMREAVNGCGTGPFMVTDYVVDTSVTYVRHDNYWQNDPLHPENQLPYADGVKSLIIPDKSSRLAGFRTGKIDVMRNLLLEDKEQFQKTNPELVWSNELPQSSKFCWRIDTPPFDDIRVRKALLMAIDRWAIVNDYYKGDAEILNEVCMPCGELEHYYTPLDELPPEARENYEYDPDRARELLADAGYPDGFKTECICTSTSVDMLSIMAGYWEDIGIDCDIKVMESGAMSGVSRNKTYTQMIWCSSNPNRAEMFNQYTAGQDQNNSMVDDPYINNLFEESAATLLTEPERNAEMVKEGIQYVISQAYSFVPPTPYYHTGWWPWIKAYNGEKTPGCWAHFDTWSKYLWIDQGLKNSMGY